MGRGTYKNRFTINEKDVPSEDAFLWNSNMLPIKRKARTLKKNVVKRNTRDPLTVEQPNLCSTSKEATFPMFSVGCHTCFDFLKIPTVHENNTSQTASIKKVDC